MYSFIKYDLWLQYRNFAVFGNKKNSQNILSELD